MSRLLTATVRVRGNGGGGTALEEGLVAASPHAVEVEHGNGRIPAAEVSDGRTGEGAAVHDLDRGLAVPHHDRIVSGRTRDLARDLAGIDIALASHAGQGSALGVCRAGTGEGAGVGDAVIVGQRVVVVALAVAGAGLAQRLHIMMALGAGREHVGTDAGVDRARVAVVAVEAVEALAAERARVLLERRGRVVGVEAGQRQIATASQIRDSHVRRSRGRHVRLARLAELLSAMVRVGRAVVTGGVAHAVGVGIALGQVGLAVGLGHELALTGVAGIGGAELAVVAVDIGHALAALVAFAPEGALQQIRVLAEAVGLALAARLGQVSGIHAVVLVEALAVGGALLAHQLHRVLAFAIDTRIVGARVRVIAVGVVHASTEALRVLAAVRAMLPRPLTHALDTLTVEGVEHRGGGGRADLGVVLALRIVDARRAVLDIRVEAPGRVAISSLTRVAFVAVDVGCTLRRQNVAVRDRDVLAHAAVERIGRTRVTVVAVEVDAGAVDAVLPGRP